MKDLFGPKPYDAKLTIPNLITAIGILLLIPYVWGFLTSGNRWVMLGSLFLSGCSDLFDGLCARFLKQKTRIGKFLDPLHDRLLLGAVLANMIFLSKTSPFEWISWITVIVVLELSIAYINLCWLRQTAKVHLAGKIRQAAHLLLCGLVILSNYFGDVILAVASIKFNFDPRTAFLLMVSFSIVALTAYSWRLIWRK